MSGTEVFGNRKPEVTHFKVLKHAPNGAREAQKAIDEEKGASVDMFPIAQAVPEWVHRQFGDGAYTLQWWILDSDGKWTGAGTGKDGVVLRAPKRRGRPPLRPRDLPSLAAAHPSPPVAPSGGGSVMPSNFVEVQQLISLLDNAQERGRQQMIDFAAVLQGNQPKPIGVDDIARAVRAAVAPLERKIAELEEELDAEPEEDELEETDPDGGEDDRDPPPRNMKQAVARSVAKAGEQVADGIPQMLEIGKTIATGLKEKWTRNEPAPSSDGTSADVTD